MKQKKNSQFISMFKLGLMHLEHGDKVAGF